MTEQTVTQETKNQVRRFNWAGIGIFFSGLAMIILFSTFVYAYLQLAKVNMSIASMVNALEVKTDENQNKLTTLKQSVTNLEQLSQKSQELSQQQEKLVTEWQAAQAGNLEKWQVAEAQYLVKLANDHLQFNDHISMALALLQRADQILQKIDSSSIIDIRKSLAGDMTSLQALPSIDITSLYISLAGLTKSLQTLPLPELPLQSNPNTQKEDTQKHPSWWRAGLAHSWQALQKIVVVRYTGANTLPLVLPEERIFLYQNLQAQLETAIWGVLHRNAEVYQNSLSRMQEWIEHYYDQKAQATQNILGTLQTLQKADLKPSKTNLDATIQLFEQYFSQTGASP